MKHHYDRSKGSGARKLYKTITQVYCGVSEREIQAILNTLEVRQKLKPKFTNKAPLRPVQSSRVWEQVQADLVTMTACTFKGYTFVYVLSVLDVFSRFLILRPLTSKSSGEVADALSQVFAEHGSREQNLKVQ